MEPQRVRAADGKLYWRIPGATWRGLFRAWMTKLAAREGLPVADSFARQSQLDDRGRRQLAETDRITGENLGWCFLPEGERTPDAATDCPIARLFGATFQASRIHFSDSLSPLVPAHQQKRMHVAVDRITGGAAESMLYDNTVLIPAADDAGPKFELVIRIKEPAEREVQWLRKTIVALDLGLLRIGSSKSSGRLGLLAPVEATGQSANMLAGVTPALVK